MPAKKLNLTGNAGTGPVVKNDSLLATETEKHATSKSLYGDHKARISSNISAISDRLRLAAYKGILGMLTGKTVLHLGCGMGLISMLAARAKAKHVVAVDSSAIVDCAVIVAQQNKVDNLTFLKGSIRSIHRDNAASMPVEKFDVILCEWMGAFLTNEGELMDDVLYCRDHLLAPNGVICPDRSSIHMVGITDYNYRRDTVDYWDNVYGFSMKPMQALVLEDASTSCIPRDYILTPPTLGHSIDIMELKVTHGDSADNNQYRTYSFPYTLKASERGTIHYLTFFVDAVFHHPRSKPEVHFELPCRPGGENAWTEVSVAMHQPIPVNKGDIVKGQVTVTPRPGKITEIEVSASCEGSVASISTTGKYYYTY